MTTTYKIKGIGCQGCIDSIEKEVNNIPSIEAKLSLADRTITVKEGSIAKSELNNILTKAGKYELL